MISGGGGGGGRERAAARRVLVFLYLSRRPGRCPSPSIENSTREDVSPHFTTVKGANQGRIFQFPASARGDNFLDPARAPRDLAGTAF